MEWGPDRVKGRMEEKKGSSRVESFFCCSHISLLVMLGGTRKVSKVIKTGLETGMTVVRAHDRPPSGAPKIMLDGDGRRGTGLSSYYDLKRTLLSRETVSIIIFVDENIQFALLESIRQRTWRMN